MKIKYCIIFLMILKSKITLLLVTSLIYNIGFVLKFQSHTQTIIITSIKEINIELLHVMEPCLSHFNGENVAVHCKFKFFFVILS